MSTHASPAASNHATTEKAKILPINYEHDLHFKAKIFGIVAPAWYCYDHIYPAQMSIVWEYPLPYPPELIDNGTGSLTDNPGRGPLVSVEMYRYVCPFTTPLGRDCRAYLQPAGGIQLHFRTIPTPRHSSMERVMLALFM